MNMMSILFCLFFSFFSVEKDGGIDTLFLKWNGVTLHSMQKTCIAIKEEDDRSICENRIASMPSFWAIDQDSLNRASVRWKFLKKIDTDTIPVKKDWTVIEVVKTGERIRLINYVLTYRKSDAVIIGYEYKAGEWIKTFHKSVRFRKSNTLFATGNIVLPSNSYPHDIIITNFVNNSIKESTYYIQNTIDNNNKIIALLKE